MTGIDGDQSNNDASLVGAAYVFVRGDDSAWSQQAYIKASNSDAGDWFGWSVSLSGDGDTLAVGARHEASSATGIDGDQSDYHAGDAGAVHVLVRVEDSTWSQQAYIKASNTNAQDYFGWSVWLSDDGDTLVVGAIHEDSSATGINGDQSNNGAYHAGAAYVF